MSTCTACNGNGGGYVSRGPDNWEWEPCEQCCGTGYTLDPRNAGLARDRVGMFLDIVGAA